MLLGFHGAINRLRNLPAASIAVVDGHCLGGGMELALACDFVLASERSRFGQPEVQLGCYPPVAAALYPSRIGHARTLEMLLTGRTYTCEEVERLGLVTWRVEANGSRAGRARDARLAPRQRARWLAHQARRAGRWRPAVPAGAREGRALPRRARHHGQQGRNFASVPRQALAPVWQHR
jgi:enoyl-CoA hydratase/carnithine racemase